MFGFLNNRPKNCPFLIILFIHWHEHGPEGYVGCLGTLTKIPSYSQLRKEALRVSVDGSGHTSISFVSRNTPTEKTNRKKKEKKNIDMTANKRLLFLIWPCLHLSH